MPGGQTCLQGRELAGHARREGVRGPRGDEEGPRGPSVGLLGRGETCRGSDPRGPLQQQVPKELEPEGRCAAREGHDGVAAPDHALEAGGGGFGVARDPPVELVEGPVELGSEVVGGVRGPEALQGPNQGHHSSSSSSCCCCQ